MGSSKSKAAKKYATPETNDDEEDFEYNHTTTTTTTSKYINSATTNPNATNKNLSTWGFPEVHHTKKSHPEVLPKWAVPKFKQWDNHNQTKQTSERIKHVKATLKHCTDFTKANRTRLLHDKILSPRTLFSEIFFKAPVHITEHECYLLETFISEQIIHWDKENEAAIFVQRVWRGHHGKATMHSMKAKQLLMKDLLKADQRLKVDRAMAEQYRQEGQKTLEEYGLQRKKQREQKEQEELERKSKQGFMCMFLASGGLKRMGPPTTAIMASGTTTTLPELPGLTDSVSQRKLHLLIKTMKRINNATQDQSAWYGVKRREYWKEWVDQTKRLHFQQQALFWNKQQWFEKWQQRIVTKKRISVLIKEMNHRLYYHYVELGFRRWWRKTRRRFRIFHSTDGLTRILQENGDFTPEHSVIISNYPLGLNREEGRDEILDRNGEQMTRRLWNGSWV